MQIKRTLQILIDFDADLSLTLQVFQEIKQRLSKPCYNDGQNLNQITLHRKMYESIKGHLNAQMSCTAIRIVASSYASAKYNRRPAQKPFGFHKKHALFLVGKRGRDASFRKDGTLSIWTINGRKKLSYTVPEYFQPIFESVNEVNSVNVVERDGQLIGFVCVTLEVSEPQGVFPVGVDLNETNIVVAADCNNRIKFIAGKSHKIANTKTRKKRQRLQQKLASKKADGYDTRSVRRAIKRLSRKQSNRTRTFCQSVAKELVQWCPQNAVLVLENLHLPQVSKKKRMRKGVRRRLSQWPRAMLTHWIESNAQKLSIALERVNPAYTSTTCSRCGLSGERNRHTFSCSSCGHIDHADVNAAVNIRNRYTVLRDGGLLSTSPEALEQSEGKPLSIASA